MKQILLILSLLGAFFVNAQTADDDFCKMVSQNKFWQPDGVSYDHFGHGDVYGGLPFYFNGTVEKNGKTYSKLVNFDDPETTLMLMREEDARVYVLFDDDFINRYHIYLYDRPELKDTDFMIYDFNLKKGDTFETLISCKLMPYDDDHLEIETRQVGEVTTIDINGHKLRVQQLLEEDGGDTPLFWDDKVIEGFGPYSYSDWFFANYVAPTGDYFYSKNEFGSVTDKNTDEVLINVEMVKQALRAVGVHDVQEENVAAGDGKTYDMMGREIKNPQPGTICIRNGRKVVVK